MFGQRGGKRERERERERQGETEVPAYPHSSRWGGLAFLRRNRKGSCAKKEGFLAPAASPHEGYLARTTPSLIPGRIPLSL